MKILISIIIACFLLTGNNLFRSSIINVYDINGKTINLSNIDIKKDTVLISLWASWCVPCIKELDSLTIKGVDKKYQVIAIAIGLGKSTIDEKEIIIKHKWPFTFYNDNEDNFRDYLIDSKVLDSCNYIKRNEKLIFSVPWNFFYSNNKLILKTKHILSHL